MPIYAIGDVQGCYDDLQRLLEKLRFDPALDSAWFAGDLVNRGGQSLETLRLVRSLGPRTVVVLGNHDLHLIAEASKSPEKQQRRNTELQAVLTAEDGPEIVRWLRHQKLAHYDPQLDVMMVHAGIAPQWTVNAALAQASSVERMLQGPQSGEFLARMYGNKPKAWTRELKGTMRARAVINALTRMRYCNVKGEICFEAKGAPGTQPPGFYPWFEVPGHRARKTKIVFGHWSTLGCLSGMGVYGIDSGCVWGGSLTALRLDAEEREFISIASARPKVNDSGD